MKTYNDVYLSTRRKLRDVAGGAHDLEARLIISHASGNSREQLLSRSKFYITDPDILKAIDDMVQRRLEGEPVAYLVGEWEFYGLPIYVNRDVLIPRVDTEVLAEMAIKLMKKRSGHTRLLDLCTGSGCVGLAIAATVPDCRVALADNSERAIAVCKSNMIKNNISRNVTPIVLNALESPPALLGTFDAIVCNPPYIPTGDISKLDKSVSKYEPVSALDGGEDGLDFFRAIASRWMDVLNKGGHILFECGFGQAQSVCKILEDSGYKEIITHLDTQRIERVIQATRI
jgi:release factor glutamine methyltransferase